MKYLIDKKIIPIILLLDILGNIFFFWTKLRKRPKSIRKVLFIRLEHLGDMILATPAFETFKKNNPGCLVHVVCKTITAPLIKNNPYVDKIIVYDAPWFIKRSADKKKGFSQIVRELRSQEYDIVFEMHGDPRNNYLAYLTGAYTIGYACRGCGFLLNKIMHYDLKIRMIRQNLWLISDFSKKEYQKTEIFTDITAKKSAARLIGKYHLKKFIIINPRSGRTEKNLTDGEVIKFIKNTKSTVVITGSREEIESNSVFRKFGNVLDLTGKLDILTLVELVRRSEDVIGPDTSIIHIAKAVSTRFHAIYKTTDKKVWGY